MSATLGEVRNALAGLRVPELDRLHRVPDHRPVAVAAQVRLRPRGTGGRLVLVIDVPPAGRSAAP